jgi:inorganic pyrophosphatase
MWYIFLPPYSPNYNPIELAFSSIKAYIRHRGDIAHTVMLDDDDTDVVVFLNKAVFSVREEDAKGWFQHSGYEI